MAVAATKLVKIETEAIRLRVLVVDVVGPAGRAAVGVPVGGIAFQAIHARDLPRCTFSVDEAEAAELALALAQGQDVTRMVDPSRLLRVERPVLQTTA